MNKTAIVTGGAGFIGSWLCEFLLEKDFFVFCIDNLSTGSESNIKHLLSGKFEFIEHDIIKPLKISNIGNINYIFHLGCIASPYYYDKLPLETLKVGSIGTFNILEIAKEKKSVFFLASSSEIYGDPKIIPTCEHNHGKLDPTGPRCEYYEAKRFSEACTKKFSSENNISIRIARIFNTYGPHMLPDDGRVVSTFIVNALNNKSLPIYGDGMQTRSFCYISDTIKCIFKLCMSNFSSPINIGNPNEYYTINELAEKVMKLTKRSVPIESRPKNPGDPKKRQPDISKAIKLLGWKPEVDLNTGINKTIEWFNEKRIENDNG